MTQDYEKPKVSDELIRGLGLYTLALMESIVAFHTPYFEAEDASTTLTLTRVSHLNGDWKITVEQLS